MSDNYARIYPSFWTGETGRRLRQEPAEVRLAAIWLLSNRNAHPTGVYYLPLPLLAHEVGISPFEGASKVLRRLSEVGFCRYDDATETVWIPEMAAHQIGRAISIGDKRRPWMLSELERIRKTPFYNDFLQRYGEAFNLGEAPPKPLASPFEGASKPLGSPSEAIPHSAFRIPHTADRMPQRADARSENSTQEDPQPLPPAPPNPDTFHARKLLVDAGLNQRQAGLYAEVYGLSYSVIRSEVEKHKGKPTGMLVNRLKDLAAVKGEAATTKVPEPVEEDRYESDKLLRETRAGFLEYQRQKAERAAQKAAQAAQTGA